MGKVLTLPVAAKATDRARTVDQIMGLGPRATPEVTLEAFLRWHPEFRVREAAVMCITLRLYDEAAAWWRAHAAHLRQALLSNGVTGERAEAIVREFTAEVRDEIKAIRASRMTDDEFFGEQVIAVVTQPSYRLGGADV